MIKKFSTYLKDYFSLRVYEQSGLFWALILSVGFILISFWLTSVSRDAPADLRKFKEIATTDADIPTQTKFERTEIAYRPFNPNLVTQEELLTMGMPPSAIKSLINYRNAGFVYRKPTDLLKCYGIDETLFEEIAPFIVILEKADKPKRDGFNNGAEDRNTKPAMAPFNFNPNTVSESELQSMQLPDRFIKGFLKYRNSGARFYNQKDMDRIFVLTPAIKTAIYPYLVFPEKKQSSYDNVQERKRGIEVLRFHFDPNRISKDSLRLLGVPPGVSETWVKYRSTGKVYRSIEDLKMIYGLSPSLLNELTPYIQFNDPKRKYASSYRKQRIQASLNIDPNLATEASLQEIKGVGPAYAAYIIRYRESLGGFVAVDQIGESEPLPDSVFQQIKYHFVSPSLDVIQPMSLNKASRRTLADHPYLSYDQASAIITHRELTGNFKDIDHLVSSKVLAPEEIQKLRRYLNFE